MADDRRDRSRASGICICAGSGGVGKTTTSAAIAPGMAARGQKVARADDRPGQAAGRLARACRSSATSRRRVDPELFERAGVEMKGELWAMMLDAKATFDELVARTRPTRRRATGSSRTASTSSSPTRWPAPRSTWRWRSSSSSTRRAATTSSSSTRRRRRNALDFLDAPERLTQFIEGRALQMFMKPTGLGDAGSSAAAARWCFGVLKRITGVDLLADLAEFFQAFSGMVDGFRERAKRVNELLADPATTFLVVCGPQGEPIDEAVYFHRKLVEAKLPVGGVIVNKVHYEAERRAREGEARGRPAATCSTTTSPSGSPQNFADYQALAERDAAQHRAPRGASCSRRP